MTTYEEDLSAMRKNDSNEAALREAARVAFIAEVIKWTGVALPLLLILLLIPVSCTPVDQTERGVHLRGGAVVRVLQPGRNWIIPFFDKAAILVVQNQTVVFDKVSAYSFDQQTATMRVSVNFHVPPEEALSVYGEFKTVGQLQMQTVDRQTPTIVENTFGQYTAIKAVQDRTKLVADVTKNLRAAIHAPIVIDSVQVENIDFSDAYEKSIELRMQAEVAIQTQRQNLETEKVNAEIVVTRAQAAADSAVATAKSAAEATRLAGDAEATAIRAKGDALRQNAGLVELTLAQQWNGVLPTTMVPGSAVPFISVK